MSISYRDKIPKIFPYFFFFNKLCTGYLDHFSSAGLSILAFYFKGKQRRKLREKKRQNGTYHGNSRQTTTAQDRQPLQNQSDNLRFRVIRYYRYILELIIGRFKLR